MAKVKVTIVFLVFLLFFSSGQVFGERLEKANDEWSIYVDPRFHFSIKYPASWVVIPRDDSDPSAMSGVVTFASVSPSTNPDKAAYAKEPKFVVGHYLAEFESHHSLSDWTDAYETVSNGIAPEIIYGRYEKSTINVNNKEALSVIGESAITEFRVTNVPHGEVVWFIWTNISGTTETTEKSIYDQAAASFTLSENSPKSLESIYGVDFKPQSLRLRRSSSKSYSPAGTVSLPSASTWIAPIATGNQYDINCGSSQHVDDEAHKYSRYAADIEMYLAPVKSSKTSWVDFAGWASGGWGNLVMASTDFLFPDVYTLHYAHLSSISVSGGQQLGTGSHVGTSGDTGVSGSYHLHFHVRSGANSVNLTGMSGFFPDSDYPDNFADCG